MKYIQHSMRCSIVGRRPKLASYTSCIFWGLFAVVVSGGSVVAEETEARRGLVTSASCPLSCTELAIPEASCRAWSVGERCFVEDFRSPAGHRSLARFRGRMGSERKHSQEMGAFAELPRTSDSNITSYSDSTATSEINAAGPSRGIRGARVGADSSRRGLITTSSCPYTCEDAGVPLEDCRETTTGTQCQVEDLRQAPGHRSMIRMP